MLSKIRFYNLVIFSFIFCFLFNHAAAQPVHRYIKISINSSREEILRQINIGSTQLRFDEQSTAKNKRMKNYINNSLQETNEKRIWYHPNDIIWTEDFEGSFPSEGWQLKGDPTWDQEFNPFPYNIYYIHVNEADISSAWCAGGGSKGVDSRYNDYPNNCNSWMISGPFSLKNIKSAEYIFRFGLDIPPGDGFGYLVSIDGEEFHGFFYYGWDVQIRSIDLNNVPGLGDLTGRDSVWVAFAFVSDASGTSWGVFIDDIQLVGSSWEELSFGQRNHLRSIFFLDENTFWVVGYGNDEDDSVWDAYAIVKTTDGGLTWKYQTCVESFGRMELESIFFIDQNIGWAVGEAISSNNDHYGIILKTTDGGTHWEHQALFDSGAIRDVHFVDENNGWVVGESVKILNTTDGGESWFEQDCGQFTGMLFALDMVNENVGWAAGPDGAICKTTDGGETWVSKNVWSIDFSDIDFIDENKGWAVGMRSDGVFMTTDGGETWEHKWFDLVRSDQGFHSVHFVDENHGWAVGKYGLIVYSDDGGQNWYFQSSGKVNKSDFRSVYFINENTGWIVGGDGTILKTSNAGRLQAGIVLEQVARPVISPRIGYYPPSLDVNLTSTTLGATIRYTLDNTEPTLSSPTYSTPITLDESSNTILNAKAWKDPIEPSKNIKAIYINAHDIEVSLPTLNEASGNQVIIPVNIGDVTETYVIGYEFTINFDPSVIRPMHPEYLWPPFEPNHDTSGTLSAEQGWSVTGFPYEDSLSITAWSSSAGLSPMRGAGVLVNLLFQAIGATGESSPLTFSSFEFNEGVPAAITTDGSFNITTGMADERIRTGAKLP
jgi:photosystem II stability/assembly factor-like uncharacterized protein